MSVAAPDEIVLERDREQISSLDEVQWGVLETSGAVSFIKKGES